MDIEKLEKLQKLKETGVLTAEEFQREKEKILNSDSQIIQEINDINSQKIKCPKCKSKNVNIQMVEDGSIGTSKTKITKKHHGLFYWLFIGWWIWFFKIFLLPFKILFGSKKTIGKATTVTASKTINKKMAICQNCGHSWQF